MEYFIPADLGTYSSTEVDGEILGKIVHQAYKSNPKLKKCYLGLIHSHHSMGAFFSKTDKDTSLEEAPSDTLYFSTVVASKPDYYAFSLSYKDNYGKPHFIEGEVLDKKKVTKHKKWVEEADFIQKEDDKKVTYHQPQNTTNNYRNSNDYYDNYYGRIWTNSYKPSKANIEIANGYLSEYEEGNIEEWEFNSKLKLLGIDSHLYVSGYYNK